MWKSTMEKAAFGSFLLPIPICYLCLLSNFTNGGHPLLGHPASFLTSKDHILPFFPSIDQKCYALVQLEGMCPSLKQPLRFLPTIHYQEEKSVYYGASIGFVQTFCSDLSFTSSFVTWKHSELRFVLCCFFFCQSLVYRALEENREFYISEF